MDWTEYFDTQTGRPPRSVLLRTLGLRGDSGPGTAVDLGCGEGTETRHLLAAGWRVHAFDADPGAEARVRGALDRPRAERLTFHSARFEDFPALPAADLVYAGFSLPFCDPKAFPGLWTGIRGALNPGAWFAGEFFGPHDAWAGRADMNFHDREGVDALLAGLDLVDVIEDDRPGQSAFGPRHWHVFHVIARA
ncbi:class I SAM-dependent methyltransferase [Cryobacterium sp. TMT1-21]|uniref:Class I SAM-dependent methyltransferase n=1 Tax=Cryobacterium shii TaxID=1259235 RepID=A0AAQ2HFK0_9MICO|nr:MULTISPECIES: class I SAM-dependent methyltransferase [Cryobacterium]TFC46640.1 class I SAM-dependent methyltransferase [Cryobacterium shii]TFC89115.1 class I SAM-dependent methyltransferase [Cryobacterium sp. TmT2-59]TFD14070.1 class I SAM-dependent methyltransferase [Cryobacterium sp. TMT4-10]TFD17658.1 class I SAM-dependent methyltransferase [Cryobacterium sp. TMT1-21]TFD22665.1 class I SAM-dependent methyltransferase [Cryobacterium sp. TMT2-23]